jgi:CRP-like cAMP-binding protein
MSTTHAVRAGFSRQLSRFNSVSPSTRIDSTRIRLDGDANETLASVCVRSAPLFVGLAEDVRSELAARAIPRPFFRRQVIFQEGDPVRYVHVLASGVVKITKLSEEGSEVILRFDRRGSPLENVGDLLETLHATNGYAVSDGRVITWDIKEFKFFVERFPVINCNAIAILRANLRTLEQSVCDLSTGYAPQRLAKVLLRLQAQDSEQDGVGLSRQELSQLTGSSVFEISRLLCQWAEREIVNVTRDGIAIHDEALLLHISKGEDE